MIVVDDSVAFYYAFNKESDDWLIELFQQKLDDMKKDGRYDAIMKRYGLE